MTNEHDSSNPGFTRREAIGLLGAGTSALLLPQNSVSAASAPLFPKGAIIRTILKDLPPEALASGATLFHEHLSHSYPMSLKIAAENRKIGEEGRRMNSQPNLTRGQATTARPPEPYAIEDLGIMVAEVSAARKDGIACIVDAGHPDTDSSIDFLTQISLRSGLPIVACAGYYYASFYPPDIPAMSEDQIAERFIRHVNVEPRGAFGEIGSSNEILPDEQKVFRAIGKAHLATNLPIFTHTAFGARRALEQLDLFEGVGVKPQSVAIGHMGSVQTPEIDTHLAICKRGAFVGFDRQGGNGDAMNVSMVLKLLEAGYADNLLFSSDYPGTTPLLKRNGGPGWSKTVTVWLPKLRVAGVKDEVLHNIMVNNPRRFLAFVPKKLIDAKYRNLRESDGPKR